MFRKTFRRGRHVQKQHPHPADGACAAGFGDPVGDLRHFLISLHEAVGDRAVREAEYEAADTRGR
ncbi:hypothetical protein D3C74_389980 [compost metagenome]